MKKRSYLTVSGAVIALATLVAVAVGGMDLHNPSSVSAGAASLPYTSYVALLTQTGTDAPTVVATLENTTGNATENLTWVYEEVGRYLLSGFSFDPAKTAVHVTNSRIGDPTAMGLILVAYIDGTTLYIRSYSQSGAATDISTGVGAITVTVHSYP